MCTKSEERERGAGVKRSTYTKHGSLHVNRRYAPFFHIGNSQDANLILIAHTDISILFSFSLLPRHFLTVYLPSKPETEKNISKVLRFFFSFHVYYLPWKWYFTRYCAIVSLRHRQPAASLPSLSMNHSGRCQCNFFPHQMCSNLLLQLLLLREKESTSYALCTFYTEYHFRHRNRSSPHCFSFIMRVCFVL